MMRLVILAISFSSIVCFAGMSAPAVGSLPTFSEDGHLQMVVEIPAGTNKKIEYEHSTNAFPVTKENGAQRTISFLPYPGNYGFIPSTLMEPAEGGDGDALDILLISEHLKIGTVVDVLPVAILLLDDNGARDDKIIAIPADETKQVISLASCRESRPEFIMAKSIIKQWFLAYKGDSSMKFNGWGGEDQARYQIRKWSLKYSTRLSSSNPP